MRCTFRLRSRLLPKLAVLLMLGALAIGCSSDDDLGTVEASERVDQDLVAQADDDDGDGDGDGGTVVTEDESATGAGADGAEPELVTIESAPDDVELVEYTSSAMGGVRFSVDPAHHLYSRGDTIMVAIEDPTGEAAWEVASVSLLTQTPRSSRVDSIERVTELIMGGQTAEVTPNGTAIEMLGYRLAGYDVRSDISNRDRNVVAADRHGTPVLTVISYTPNARMFLAETPAGVLVAASAEADDPSNIDAIDVALGTLVNTIEFTGDGLEAPLPSGETLWITDTKPSEARGVLDPDGPDALDSPGVPVEPGTYQLANFGPTFTLDFAEDMHTQPNFPGFIVLTGPQSYGPGERDIVFLTGIVDMVSIAPGPVAVGEPVLLTTADDVIDALSTDLEISGREEIDLDGLAATRFDVRIPSDALCNNDEPCEYAFRTSWGNTIALRSTQEHRIWWIEDGAEGPSLILAMAPPGGDFIEMATELLDTMTFNPTDAVGGDDAANVRTAAIEEEAMFYDIDLSDEAWACIADEGILDVELDGAPLSYLHYLALQRCASTELTTGVVAQAAESTKFTEESLDLLGCVYDGFAEHQAQYSVEELLARSQLRGTADGDANETEANETVAASCDVFVVDVNAVLALQR